jgi:hypothetical protein
MSDFKYGYCQRPDFSYQVYYQDPEDPMACYEVCGGLTKRQAMRVYKEIRRLHDGI